MSRTTAALLVLLLTAVTAAVARAEPPRILLVTEENPPANFTDPMTGQFAGVAHEKVVEMMKRAGLSYRWRLLPWQEAFDLARTTPDVCVYMTNITEERLPDFRWVSPLMTGGWALFARSGWEGRIDRAEDLKGLRVGVQQASAVEANLQALSDQIGGLFVDPTPGFVNLHRLEKGEIDLYAAGIWSGSFQARQERVAVRLVYRLTMSIGALACHRDMAADVVARMQAALESLISDGTADLIDERYYRPMGWARGLIEE